MSDFNVWREFALNSQRYTSITTGVIRISHNSEHALLTMFNTVLFYLKCNQIKLFWQFYIHRLNLSFVLVTTINKCWQVVDTFLFKRLIGLNLVEEIVVLSIFLPETCCCWCFVLCTVVYWSTGLVGGLGYCTLYWFVRTKTGTEGLSSCPVCDLLKWLIDHISWAAASCFKLCLRNVFIWISIAI